MADTSGSPRLVGPPAQTIGRLRDLEAVDVQHRAAIAVAPTAPAVFTGRVNGFAEEIMPRVQ